MGRVHTPMLWVTREAIAMRVEGGRMQERERERTVVYSDLGKRTFGNIPPNAPHPVWIPLLLEREIYGVVGVSPSPSFFFN